MYNFDLFGQIGKEIQSFKTDKILIAGTQPETGRYLGKDTKGYKFSQWETLNLIDLYYNSKFETGLTDSEGQRKLFLNICAFRADVASKMIDLDTKDFIFVPDEDSSKWGTWFIAKEFKDWSRESYFGEFINELVENFPKYGTLVVKKVGKKLERVPLRNLICQQNAKDLEHSSHVIVVHEDMSYEDMKEFPDWDLSGLDMPFGTTKTVYERYGYVPASFYNRVKDIPGEVKENDTVRCMIISTCDEKVGAKAGEYIGNIMFMEKIKDLSDIFQEVHWKKQDGRWLGIGEIENQFENQISRNMIANLRRRALLWSSKKIFQSPDDTIAKNLIRDVKDGDVLRIMPNGNITQVDMASRQMGEFSSTEAVWEDNSNQKSFTYEMATGEAMPSGTSFRLGVMISNSVASHFRFKKQKLGLFLKRLVLEQVFEIFKQENSKEHTMMIFGTEEGFNDLKKVASNIVFNKRIVELAFNDNGSVVPDFNLIKTLIEDQFKKKPSLQITIPDSYYDTVKHHMELVITGEEVDTKAKIETLTTLYQSMVAKGDSRADQILDKIMGYTGENLEAILGTLPPPAPVPQTGPVKIPAMKNTPQNTMNDMAMSNAKGTSSETL